MPPREAATGEILQCSLPHNGGLQHRSAARHPSKMTGFSVVRRRSAPLACGAVCCIYFGFFCCPPTVSSFGGNLLLLLNIRILGASRTKGDTAHLSRPVYTKRILMSMGLFVTLLGGTGGITSRFRPIRLYSLSQDFP